MYATLLLLHLLGATIWTGGHIVLSVVVVLPRALKEKSAERLLDFEQVYEKIGMPALIVQILTGLGLAYRYLPDVSQWFNPANPLAHGIMAKLGLLTLTFGLALHARFRVIPVLSAANLGVMAWHIVPMTLLAILFVVMGVAFRAGWFI